MTNVRNYTIGDPSQPGKMVVLNGNLDTYDTRGALSISNGVSLNGVLGYANLTADYTNLSNVNLGQVLQDSLLTITIPTTNRAVRFTAQVAAAPVSGTIPVLQLVLNDKLGRVNGLYSLGNLPGGVSNPTTFLWQWIIRYPSAETNTFWLTAYPFITSTSVSIRNASYGFNNFFMAELV